ncbi:MAG: single-stranded DNA-binding protein [Ruminococcus sp.]
MNNVALTGRLVADPELKTTPSGVEVTSFRIAVNQNYVKQGEERKADFFNIVAWRQTAAFICRYFHKGDGIDIIGKLQSRSYVANDGTNRYVVEVVADSVEFPLGNSKKEGQEYNQVTAVPSTPSQPVDVSQLTVDDDLPF